MSSLPDRVCPYKQSTGILFKGLLLSGKADKTKADREAKKAITITVSVYVLCVVVPTGLHTVSKNSAPRNVKR